jgi:hypothetical protein
MPGKMARSDPRPSVRVTRGAGSGQHLASVLQEGRENANIDAGLGFIWRISVKDSVDHLTSGFLARPYESGDLAEGLSGCHPNRVQAKKRQFEQET